MKKLAQFILAAPRIAMGGGPLFLAYEAVLLCLAIGGAVAYVVQLRDGLAITGLTDQVAWGAYIANFTFGVGLAAAASMIVIPAYAFREPSLKRVVFIGEMLAVSAVLISMLFVGVDIGHPERAWHLIPAWGWLAFPGSMMAWDIVILSGFLVINVWLLTYQHYRKFHGEPVSQRWYIPVIFVSMAWAIAVRVVSAFLYSWLGARPFWNDAVVAPRAIAAAFVCGPAFFILTLRVVHHFTRFKVEDRAVDVLRRILSVALLLDLLLFGSEVFNSFYGGGSHAVSAHYMLFGHGEHRGLVPWVWSGVACIVFAAVVTLTPLRRRYGLLNLACVLAFVGVWIEKGMGLVIPGFVPSPLGEFVEYQPSPLEALICIGIWALGLLIFSWFVKLGVAVETGEARAPGAREQAA